jgi:hypothetical protein
LQKRQKRPSSERALTRFKQWQVDEDREKSTRVNLPWFNSEGRRAVKPVVRPGTVRRIYGGRIFNAGAASFFQQRRFIK